MIKTHSRVRRVVGSFAAAAVMAATAGGVASAAPTADAEAMNSPFEPRCSPYGDVDDLGDPDNYIPGTLECLDQWDSYLDELRASGFNGDTDTECQQWYLDTKCWGTSDRESETMIRNGGDGRGMVQRYIDGVFVDQDLLDAYNPADDDCEYQPGGPECPAGTVATRSAAQSFGLVTDDRDEVLERGITYVVTPLSGSSYVPNVFARTIMPLTNVWADEDNTNVLDIRFEAA